MMFEIKKSRVAYILWSTIAGKISFFLSGIIASIFIIRQIDNFILATVLAGGLGALFWILKDERDDEAWDH